MPRVKVLGTWRSLLGGSQLLPAPPSEDKTSPAPTMGLDTLSRYPPALWGLQRQRKALPNSQPTCSQASGLGWPPPLWGPLQVTIILSSGALMLWGIQPEGQSCWSPRTGPQDHADLLREPLRHAHQHSPAGCTTQGLPSRPHPSVPGAGHGGSWPPPRQ